jgi:hypothetical protein
MSHSYVFRSRMQDKHQRTSAYFALAMVACLFSAVLPQAYGQAAPGPGYYAPGSGPHKFGGYAHSDSTQQGPNNGSSVPGGSNNKFGGYSHTDSPQGPNGSSYASGGNNNAPAGGASNRGSTPPNGGSYSPPDSYYHGAAPNSALAPRPTVQSSDEQRRADDERLSANMRKAGYSEQRIQAALKISHPAFQGRRIPGAMRMYDDGSNTNATVNAMQGMSRTMSGGRSYEQQENDKRKQAEWDRDHGVQTSGSAAKYRNDQ